MRIRSRLSENWPILLAIVSAGLIAVYFLDLFFPTLLRSGTPQRSVHISCFAYRDVNRNGVYDLEDRPYAGLKVTVNRPYSGAVSEESNISGFANFDMSLDSDAAHIFAPGDHTVHVEAPRNWQVTSGNSTQTIVIKKREHSATGLVAERTLDAVGVAPNLSVSGTVAITTGDADAALTARPPGGEPFDVPLSENGTFSFPARPGVWNLVLTAGDEDTITRELTVDHYPVVVSAFGSGFASTPGKPNRRTIGFDDLTPSDTLYEIPNGYAGLNWRNWVATHQKLYKGNGYINSTVSSEYLAYMSAGHPAEITSGRTFDFVGAYVGAAWPEAEDYDVVIKAWRQDVEVHRDRIRVSAAGPLYFDANYREISKIEFSSEGYWQIVLDDVTIARD